MIIALLYIILLFFTGALCTSFLFQLQNYTKYSSSYVKICQLNLWLNLYRVAQF